MKDTPSQSERQVPLPFPETEAHARVVGEYSRADKKAVRQAYIEACRGVVDAWLDRYGTVCMDDVVDMFPPRPETVHYNIAGAIMNSKHYQHVGYRRSRRPDAHGNVLGVWARKDQ